MTSNPTAEKTIVYALLGMTMVTGLVDAVSARTLRSEWKSTTRPQEQALVQNESGRFTVQK